MAKPSSWPSRVRPLSAYFYYSLLDDNFVFIDILVIYLVARYNKESMVIVFGYFVLLVSVGYVMLSGVVPFNLLATLYSSNIVVFAASRVPQIIETLKVHH